MQADPFLAETERLQGPSEEQSLDVPFSEPDVWGIRSLVALHRVGMPLFRRHFHQKAGET